MASCAAAIPVSASSPGAAEGVGTMTSPVTSCLMQSATVVVAFAARRLGSHTLLAHLEHQRPQTPVSRRGQPHDRRAALAKIDQELRAIEALAIQDRH